MVVWAACPWHDPGLSHSPKISFMSVSFVMEHLTSNRNLAHVAQVVSMKSKKENIY